MTISLKGLTCHFMYVDRHLLGVCRTSLIALRKFLLEMTPRHQLRGKNGVQQDSVLGTLLFILYTAQVEVRIGLHGL